ncbi:MAG TPA: hypothetical protein VNM90_15500 [Haliangium sp.]|nr:hypothetical protein [Haliangium sp.]
MNTPLSFVHTWSARHGALVEALDAGAEILQPAWLAMTLGVPEHARYVEQPAEDAVWAGYGSPVLDRLLQEATRHVPWTALVLESDTPPRETAARTAAERLGLRNAVHALESLLMSTAPRLVVHARYALIADDRRDGLLDETVSVRGRTSVPGFWAAARAGGKLRAASTRPGDAELSAAAASALLRVEARARAQSRGFLDGFARRQERDERRIETYFDGLLAELRKRARRNKLTAEDIALKQQAVERERASKLHELKERGQVRCTVAIAAALCVQSPVALLSFEVRRRKARRTMALEYDFTTMHLLPPACDACGLDAREPALCDDRLHAVCSACVPRAEGRWSCPACRGPGSARLTRAAAEQVQVPSTSR